MGRIIAVANQKGGIGKTTTAVALAAGLSKKGFKTLLIDTDSQCNATDTYQAETEETATIVDLLFEQEPAINCIQKTEAGHIIASDPLMQNAETKFPNDPSKPYLLKKACANLTDIYDYIIIDTPPTIGSILSNVLTYAHEVIIPVTCDRYGLVGLDLLNRSMESTREFTNPDLKILGLLMIKHSDRLNLNKSVMDGLEQVAKNLNTKIFNSKIRESVACRESQVARKSIYDYAPNSTTTKDYESLCDEII